MFTWLTLALALVVDAGAVPGKAQFTLRFPQLRAHSSALTGCYGTASYQYVLPDVATIKAYREALLEQADLAELQGFAWSSQQYASDTTKVLGVDLATGEVKPKSKLGQGDYGLVFCLCRSPYLRNCTPSPLPPLGRPFPGGVVTVEPEP